jgi:hypothetical protein
MPVLAKGATKLIWQFGVMTEQGPLVADRPESSVFSSDSACKAFGEAMTSRVQDWVRGLVQMDWDHAVAVKYRCELDGEGA